VVFRLVPMLMILNGQTYMQSPVTKTVICCGHWGISACGRRSSSSISSGQPNCVFRLKYWLVPRMRMVSWYTKKLWSFWTWYLEWFANDYSCIICHTPTVSGLKILLQFFWPIGLQLVLRGSAVERQSLASVLSPFCVRPVADGWPLIWVSRPL